MNQKVRRSFLIVVLMTMSIIYEGCSYYKESEKESAKETFQFVDVKGVEYEAPLLENVPMNTYDYDLLSKKNGYPCYTDKDGKVISKLGIDVSEYQNPVNWQQVKNAGVEYVMIRVGYRGYGEEGRLVEDAMFRSHMEGAVAAGLEVGVYFFSQAINEKETLEEVQFVLDRIKEYPVTYPVVYDTEEIKDDVARTDNLTEEQFTQNCITFCDAIREAGYDTMIYANMKWMAFTLDMRKLTEYEKWYADYEPVPQCPYEFSMWQYTETGQLPGIEGNVDLNLWFEE
ncbi:MAG: glycoside hydrolase family 25 protein [Lachnospiraceae bacterium]|nr:glycoside hydrolase family 25 protein [Lachnospiraceae bacterium]